MAFLTDGEIFDTFPRLINYHKNVAGLNGLRQYLNSEDCVDKIYTFNNKMVKINNDPGSNVDEIMQAL